MTPAERSVLGVLRTGALRESVVSSNYARYESPLNTFATGLRQPHPLLYPHGNVCVLSCCRSWIVRQRGFLNVQRVVQNVTFWTFYFVPARSAWRDVSALQAAQAHYSSPSVTLRRVLVCN